ncbi:uncharacterized protein K02A2.6-like [Daphnia pulex]|uniref:uncharacterized protein K02A2.6-like n=1 Tax=Daphnia pulex TaxID=6669 RepID=UPI001EDFAF11|nr:uncharacterized protein K02A2.6-like [Daphnia pulex]
MNRGKSRGRGRLVESQIGQEQDIESQQEEEGSIPFVTDSIQEQTARSTEEAVADPVIPPPMATNVIGTLEPFNTETGKWQVYEKRLQQFFIVNSITEDVKKKAYLLTVLGAEICDLIWDLFSPTDPTAATVTHDMICTKLREHFVPTKVEIAERFRFFQYKQKPEETIASFMASLRNLAKDCSFGDFLNSALRDAFVIGLQDQRIQTKLLAESALTLDSAFKMAVSMESATQQAKQLRQEEPINVLRTRTTGCWRCGEPHNPAGCYFKTQECFYCKKEGHRAACCPEKQKKKSRESEKSREEKAAIPKKKDSTKKNRLNFADNTEDAEGLEDFDPDTDFNFFYLPDPNRSTKPLVTTLDIDGRKVTMEIDTGAGFTIFSEKEWRNHGSPKLEDTQVRLRTYTGQPVDIKGKFVAEVSVQEQSKQLPILVAGGNGPPLCGRNWLRAMRLDWNQILQLTNHPSTIPLSNMLPDCFQKKFTDLFSTKLGKIRGPPVHLDLKAEAVPRFHRARPIPYALRAKVKAALIKLTEAKVLKRVRHSNWGAPIVVVPKANGDIRVCGDYKAYNQLELDEFSQELCTINTPEGLFQYTRMPFGIASAPGKFQRVMDDLFQDTPWVKCYLDDILIAGRTEKEHWTRVEIVLQKLQEAGVRLQLEKCSFGVPEIPYLGFIVSKDGLKTSPEKIKAVQDSEKPHNLTSLRAYLGLVNYYGKFIPKLAHVSAPLNELLKKEKPWRWETEQQDAWLEIKQLLSSAEVLCNYNPKWILKLACDASPFGVAAVLSHILPDGSERPISYASKSLSASEKNYSQLDKEALSIIFGVKRFHSYLYGRKFTLITDHKPLLAILGPKKGIPPLAAARMQRWALILAAYSYELEFRKTTEHGNADALSRFPLEDPSETVGQLPELSHSRPELFGTALVTKDVRESTELDPVLQEVSTRLRDGWRFSDKVSSTLATFYRKRTELSIKDGLILWGNRVVIPKTLQPQVLSLLHEEHAGIVRMKAVARSFIWWPGLDSQLTEMATSCLPCLQTRNNPKRRKEAAWPVPDQPWSRLHVDFAGPLPSGQYLFVLMDATSKWPEIFRLNRITSDTTISTLKTIFARFGLPSELVSDNGPQFTSEEFKRFMLVNGIVHHRGAPYHPQTNGLAERAVQSVKKALHKMRDQPGTFDDKLQCFLTSYRNTPHKSTGKTPAEVLLGRQNRGKFDLFQPTVLKKKEKIEAEFQAGEKVMVRGFRPGKNKWLEGVVNHRIGSFLYEVQIGNQIMKRHCSQLLPRGRTEPEETGHVMLPQVKSESRDQLVVTTGIATENQPPMASPTPSQATAGPKDLPAVPTEAEVMEKQPAVLSPPPRRSTRACKLPNYLNDYVLKNVHFC